MAEPADWFGPLPGARILLGSRELLDWTIRGEVLRDRRIRIRDGCLATGLVGGPDGRSITGVRLRGGDPLPARFVVDATGRTSKAPAWLTALGHQAPETTRYDSHLGYSSRYFTIPPDPARRWHGMYVQGRPDSPRGGVLVPLDGDRWLATLVGNGEHAPPTGDEEFLGFARSLRSPALYDALRGRHRSLRRPASGAPRTSGGTTSASRAARPASSRSATRPAGSTRCTGTG